MKIRFNNHKQSLVHRHKRNATELSKAVWNAKDAGTNPSIKWSIAAKANPYQPGTKSCNLFLAENLAILQSNPATKLNKRSQLSSKCAATKTSSNLKSFIAGVLKLGGANFYKGGANDLVIVFVKRT